MVGTNLKMVLFRYKDSKWDEGYIETIDGLLAIRFWIVRKTGVLLSRGLIEQVTAKKRIIIIASYAIAKTGGGRIDWVDWMED